MFVISGPHPPNHYSPRHISTEWTFIAVNKVENYRQRAGPELFWVIWSLQEGDCKDYRHLVYRYKVILAIASVILYHLWPGKIYLGDNAGADCTCSFSCLFHMGNSCSLCVVPGNRDPNSKSR